jgi:hypothetical protein
MLRLTSMYRIESMGSVHQPATATFSASGNHIIRQGTALIMLANPHELWAEGFRRPGSGVDIFGDQAAGR